LFVPDYTRENFRGSSGHGGHDHGRRGLRYLDWTWDPDEADTTCVSYMVYLLREGADEVRCVLDKHVCGLFGHEDWLRLMAQVGFEARSMPFEHREIEPGICEVFVGIKL